MLDEFTHAPRWNLATPLQQLIAVLRQPLIVVGMAVIGLTWLVVVIKIQSEAEQAERQSIADARNYALLFEQDVLRTASELDRTIKYLRQNYVRQNYALEWQSLVKEEHTINNRTVQIAIIDRDGSMITSSAMLTPAKRVDLSDREHFRVHTGTSQDRLFISRPVIGRASNRWSIQFTRPFYVANGTFAGVIVVSLDPDALTSTYSQLAENQGSSFVLLGTDDIVRASAGTDSDQIGSAYREVERVVLDAGLTDGTEIAREVHSGKLRLVASRRVGSLPLVVVVRGPLTHVASANAESRLYIFTALAISLAVSFGVAQSLFRQRMRFRQVAIMAHTDMLTGVHNRHSFQRMIDHQFKRQKDDRQFALHLIDLDKFKAVNDTFGHQVGDQLLKAVAARLKGAIRTTDCVFRLGGDEFALMQNECTTYEQAGVVAARLCRVLAEPFLIDHNKLTIGASVGVVAGADIRRNAGHLLQSADMALYLAKSEGRGVYRFYDPKMDEVHARRRQLEIDLATAVERGELELHYQPKLALQPHIHVTGFEALVRWRHPVHGLMPPLEFIQLAEDTGSIVQIGTWVLHQACRDMAQIPGACAIAVNCSAIQFVRSNVHQDVMDALADSGLEPQRLEIEITETMLMRNDHTTLEQLEKIRALGTHISLDDFGTGYSSLSYLHTYPVDCIKIDRSFVKTIGSERDASPIIRTIVAMARELGLSTVAEGVETAEQLTALQQFGCTAVQGYLFSPPKPGRDILHWAHTPPPERVAA